MFRLVSLRNNTVFTVCSQRRTIYPKNADLQHPRDGFVRFFVKNLLIKISALVS